MVRRSPPTRLRAGAKRASTRAACASRLTTYRTPTKTRRRASGAQSSGPTRACLRRRDAFLADAGAFPLHRRWRSCGSRHVFANDPWMTRRNAQERQCSSFRLPSILFPVTKRVHADAEGFGEVGLRQADEPTQRSHIARLKLAAHDALPLAATWGATSTSTSTSTAPSCDLA